VDRYEKAFEIQSDMKDESVEDILNYLNQYTVEFPVEEEIDSTIDVLKQYMPNKNERMAKFCLLVRMAADEITFISKTYWIACTILFIIGYWTTMREIDNPYATIIVFAPLPFVLGILEIFKGRDNGMSEIELSCKISSSEIIISRIILIGIYSVLMNTALACLLYIFDNSIDFMRISVLWLSPFTFISGISLWVVMKIKGAYVVNVLISIWCILAYFAFTNDTVIKILLKLNNAVYLGIIFIGIILIAFQIKNSANRYNNIFERGNEIEAGT